MKSFIAIALIAMSGIANASNYIEVAKSDTETIYFKKKSYMVGKNDGGEVINIVTGRGVIKNDPEPIDFIIYVTQSDCDRKKGDVYYVNSEGEVIKSYPFSYAVPKNGMTIIARNICKIAEVYAAQPTM